MTSVGHTPTARPNRSARLIATSVALVLAALVIPAAANAKDDRVDGVRAELEHGTLEVSGGQHSNTAALRLKAGDPGIIEVDVGDDRSADFAFGRSQIAAIEVRMGRADDAARIDDSNGAFTDSIPTSISGGNGDDSLAGGQVQVAAENEAFEGGNGDDLVDGGKGADSADLGNGNDTFRWDNGEGSDAIEGDHGRDTMLFNGAPVSENVTTSEKEGRLSFFRTQGNVAMDADGVEIVDFNALGGNDTVAVNDLSATDVVETNIDLAAALGGSASDGVVDSVVVNGTEGDDDIDVTGSGSAAEVSGLASAVSIAHADPTDKLSVNTLAGNDNVLVTGVAGVLELLVDGAPPA